MIICIRKKNRIKWATLIGTIFVAYGSISFSRPNWSFWAYAMRGIPFTAKIYTQTRCSGCSFMLIRTEKTVSNFIPHHASCSVYTWTDVWWQSKPALLSLSLFTRSVFLFRSPGFEIDVNLLCRLNLCVFIYIAMILFCPRIFLCLL